MSAGVNATRSATKVLLRERVLEPNVNVFCTKIVQFRSRAEQTVATQACYKEGRLSPQGLGDFYDFAAKKGILTLFKSHFARFKTKPDIRSQT